MKSALPHVLAAALLAAAPSPAAVMQLWDHAKDGKVPEHLGDLSPGTSRVTGITGSGTVSGDFTNLVQFTVPAGLRLEGFLADATGGSTTVAFNLYSYPNDLLVPVGSGFFAPEAGAVDLLASGEAAPGFQPPGDYVFRVAGGEGSTYNVDMVFAPVPEPSAAALGALSLGALALGRRRSMDTPL